MEAHKKLSKVLILGLDSLEYDLVEEYDIKSLKQVEYEKIDLLLKKHEEPITPLIWGSFITGKNPEEHGIKSFHKWNNPIINKIASSNLMNFLDRKTSVQFHNILDKLGFKAHPPTRFDIKCDTLFDIIPNSIPISVPSFNEDECNKKIRKMLVKAPKLCTKLEAWKAFQDRKKRLLEALNGGWSLLFAHFFVLDTIQHLYFYDSNYIRTVYEEIGDFVGEIKEKIDDDVRVLIISDHGQKGGLHTPYGFYSCNRRLNLQKPKITDFFHIVLEQLGIPSQSEMERVKERLRRLGYI